MDNYGKSRAVGTAFLKWLECEFFGLFIFLSLLALTLVLGRVGKFVFGLCGFLCAMCVLCDFGFKEGKRARVKDQLRGENIRASFGLVLGLCAVSPWLISYGVLLLSYGGVIGSAVGFFKAMNLGIWGWLDLFVKGFDIAKVPSSMLIFYPILCLVALISVYIAFRIGFDDIDIKRKLVYEN